MEISSYAKYDITGPGAEGFLDRIVAGRIPKEGRIALNPMLNRAGRLIGDFTVARLGPDRFFMIGAGVAEAYHMRWFETEMPAGGVTIRPWALDLVGLTIAGPRSREVLQALVHDDLSTEAFPFLSIRRMEVGLIPALVARISFTGDLGYEFWVRPDHQLALYDALMAAGEPHGIGLFGSRALNAMRLEKGYGSWAREYRPIYTPREAGLERLVKLDKGNFIGRDAVVRDSNRPPRWKLVQFEIDADRADAFGDEAIMLDGKAVGWVTSGGYAATTGKSVALGYVETAYAEQDAGFAVEIIGVPRAARRLTAPLFDPEGTRLRA